MKKYLLPLAALLLGSASLSAEEVTVKYYAVDMSAEKVTDVEVFKPTTHEVFDNGDGTYTLKNFLNAVNGQQTAKDLQFSFDESGYMKFVGYTGNNYSYSNLNPSGLGGADYYTNLQGLDGTDYSFTAYMWIPAASYKYTASKVTTLADNSGYTYNVAIEAAFGGKQAECPACLSDYWLSYPLGAAFVCVFDMGKKDKPEQPEQPGDDDGNTVTVQYFNDGDADWFANKEVMAPTKSGFLINEDGSYTLKNWQNSGADLTFNLSNSAVQIGSKYETFGKKQISIVSPTIGGYVTSSTVIENPAGGNYEANLTTKEGLQISTLDYATFNDVVVDIPVQDFTTPLYITKGYCGWELVEDTDEATVYKVILRTEWKVPNPDYGKDGGINSTMATYSVPGWSIFNFSVAKPKLEEGQYMMTFTPYLQDDNVVAKKAYEIEVKDENNIVIKNFLDSGYDIPMVFDKPDAVDGFEYYAVGRLMPTEEYQNASRIKLPNGATFVANIPGTAISISDPQFYYSNYAWVRYYNEDGKVKRSIRVMFGSPYYCADWEMYVTNGDESGIEDVVVDENAPAEWYNLQGVRVSGENLAPGIYIKRQGSKTVKVLVK